MRKTILLILLLMLALSPAVTADWAYGFVVYSGNTYVLEKTEVEATQRSLVYFHLRNRNNT